MHVADGDVRGVARDVPRLEPGVGEAELALRPHLPLRAQHRRRGAGDADLVAAPQRHQPGRPPLVGQADVALCVVPGGVAGLGDRRRGVEGLVAPADADAGQLAILARGPDALLAQRQHRVAVEAVDARGREVADRIGGAHIGAGRRAVGGDRVEQDPRAAHAVRAERMHGGGQVAERRHVVAAQPQLAPRARHLHRGAPPPGQAAADRVLVVGAGGAAGAVVHGHRRLQPEAHLEPAAQVLGAAHAEAAGGVAVAVDQMARVGPAGLQRLHADVHQAEQLHAGGSLRLRAGGGQQAQADRRGLGDGGGGGGGGGGEGPGGRAPRMRGRCLQRCLRLVSLLSCPRRDRSSY